MSTLTSTGVAHLPKVNLLPPEIEQARRFRKLQAGLGLGVLASVGVVAALVLSASGQVSDAKGDLADAKAESTRLQSVEKQYAEVPLVYAQVDMADAQLQQAMDKEVRWSYFLNDLSLRIPSQVWLEKMTMAQTVDPAPTTGAAAAAVGAPTAAAPYLDAGLGTVQFQGKTKAYEHNQVAYFLQSLAKQKGYDQPYFSRSEIIEDSDTPLTEFEAKVSITEDALSNRYTDKAGS